MLRKFQENLGQGSICPKPAEVVYQLEEAFSTSELNALSSVSRYL
jgi:hypothetical protein